MTQIPYDDFQRMDIRVAKIISVENIPGKSRIIKGTIDIGERQIDVIIGGAEYYEPDSLIGKLVVVITNLEPKNIAGIESSAMLLAADVAGKPYWLTVDGNVPIGSQIK